MIRKGIKYLCSEYWNIENYEQAVNDETQIWDCHHRLEIDENGKTKYSRKNLIDNGIYYYRPAEELIFLTKNEHRLLHKKGENNYWYGKHHTEETKQKIKNSEICSKVICLNNMLVYDSLRAAAKEFNVNVGNIGKVCKGERPHTCGLKFMYYDEYERLNNNNTGNNCDSVTLF